MNNGGVYGSRGYIFQSIVALIDCLERNDWDEIKVEPPKQNKIDIQLYRNGKVLSAVQVKSSVNAFKKSDAQKYLNEAKLDAPDAKEVYVYLITDTYSTSIKQFAQEDLNIKEFPFKHLETLCKGKLVDYVDRVGLGQIITASNLILIYQTLFATIILNSKATEPISRYAFEVEFQRALQTKSNTTSKSDTVSASEKNKKEYYDYVLEKYKERNEGNELLGEESLEELYMQPSYYKSENRFGNVAQLFDDFISKGDSGVLWIVGEPGHGKTSMCIKAVADYSLKKRYQQVSGVFWFRLNPHDVPEMVGNQKLSLEKVFSWGVTDDSRDKTFSLDEMKGGLVFLDGFDELKSSLEKNDILDNRFHTQVNQLAKRYKMHIVVTSRTRALEQVKSCTEENLISGNAEIKCEFRDGSSRKNAVKMLAPLTNKEQLKWINDLIKLRKRTGKDTSDLERYRKTFHSLQKNEYIKGLLEIPILLRMIVQNCYEPSSGNRVDLYRSLFNKTLLRQGIEEQRDRLHSVYCQIAFRIFVYDDDSAEFHKGEFKDIAGSDAYLYQYYLHTPETGAGPDKEDKYRITFLHRSFYQYFLSEFLYEKFKAITDVQSGKDFLKYLWSRRLDNYVLDNFRYMAKGVNTACNCVLSAIEETDAILPIYENVSYAKERIGNYDMANNVFWNAVSTCNRLFQKDNSHESLDLTGRIAELISKYDCSEISLELFSLKDANLSVANLYCADLSGADLSFADLTRADLTGADLRSADLTRAHLTRAYLTRVHLTRAHLIRAYLTRADLRSADLRHADLRRADLSIANLTGADLFRADLRNADLFGASLFGANLEKAKVSRSQYDYISKQNVKNLDKVIVVDDE